MYKFSTVALLGALVAVGTPAAAQISVDPNDALWLAMPDLSVAANANTGTPYWNNSSSDNPANACNVGFILTGLGGAPSCNGTGDLLGVDAEYFNDSAVRFNFAAGEYEFRVFTNIAGFTPPQQRLVATTGSAEINLLSQGIPSASPIIVDFGSSSFYLSANSFNPAGAVRSDMLFGSETRSRWALFQTEDQGTTFIGFEDNVAGDFDYNDFVISVRFLGDSRLVPEPASMALVGLGLAGLAVVSRRRSVIS